MRNHQISDAERIPQILCSSCVDQPTVNFSKITALQWNRWKWPSPLSNSRNCDNSLSRNNAPVQRISEKIILLRGAFCAACGKPQKRSPAGHVLVPEIPSCHKCCHCTEEESLETMTTSLGFPSTPVNAVGLRFPVYVLHAPALCRPLAWKLKSKWFERRAHQNSMSSRLRSFVHWWLWLRLWWCLLLW